ncbi:MAG: hypothetical protein LCH79_15285 [Proteobacteria bacterium]|nr:hypothetical protein [Pseudomonadota bacterium]
MTKTKKMAVLGLNPAALRNVLRLPDDAEVIRIETVPGYRGLVNVIVEGVGWEVQEGGPLPPSTHGVFTVDRDERGGIKRLTVDWGFPLPRADAKDYVEVERPLTLMALRHKAREFMRAAPEADNWRRLRRPYRVLISPDEARELETMGEYGAGIPGLVMRSEYGPKEERKARPNEFARVECWAIDVDEPAGTMQERRHAEIEESELDPFGDKFEAEHQTKHGYS